jgi:predicted RNase H-like HicB family nuclease
VKTVAKYKYEVVVEKAENNYSAYSPDVPGCGATGETEEEVIEQIQQAIEYHLEDLKEQGLPIPEPNTNKRFVVEVNV